MSGAPQRDGQMSLFPLHSERGHDMILDIAGKITPHPSISTQNLVLVIMLVVLGIVAVVAAVTRKRRRGGDEG